MSVHDANNKSKTSKASNLESFITDDGIRIIKEVFQKLNKGLRNLKLVLNINPSIWQ